MATEAQSSTFDELQRCIAAGASGRLTVGAGSGEIAVFLLDGHVVAIRATDDTSALVERLAQEGHLPEAKAQQMQQMQQMSASMLGRETVDPIVRMLVDEIDPDVMADVLGTRFDENLARFVGHRGQPRFDDGDVPWALNLQIGHDSGARVAQAAELWRLANLIDPQMPVTMGAMAPNDPFAQQVAKAVGDGGTLAEVASRMPLPDLVARAMLSRALEDGLIVEPEEEVEEEDEELEAFSGMSDHNRGGGQGGRFSTEVHNLDRVELVDVVDVDTGSGPRTFSAPTLAEDEAFEKIGVANEVLTVVATAIDAQGGEVSGREVAQLLVDGRPRDFIPLFDGIQVRKAGDLPPKTLLANLRQRPDTEQRRLLNRGLIDLLERALDKAADALEEDAFDAVLAEVMGYRQRLGL